MKGAVIKPIAPVSKQCSRNMERPRASSLTTPGAKSSRLLSSFPTNSQLTKGKSKSSDDLLTKSAGSPISSSLRLKKTVPMGTITELSEDKAKSSSGLSCSNRRSAIPTSRDSTSVGKGKLSCERFRVPLCKKTATVISSDTVAPTRPLPTALKTRAQGEGSAQAKLETQIKELLTEAKAKDFEISKLRCELKHQQDKHEKNDLEELSVFPGMVESQIKKLEQKKQILQHELEEMRVEKQTLQEQLEQLREGVQSVTGGNSLSLEVSLYSDPSCSLCTPTSLESTRTYTRETFDNSVLVINGDRSQSSFSNMSSVTPYPDSVDLNRAFNLSPGSANGFEGNINSNQEPLKNTGSVSVDCLAEKLHQMEEKQHCMAEELQATLQELCDQQQVVQELTAENERLLEEKANLENSFQLQQERLQQLVKEKEALDSLKVNRETELADSVQRHEGKLLTTQQSVSNYQTLQEDKPRTEVQLEGLSNEVRMLQKLLKAEQELNASLTDSMAESQAENTGLRNQLQKYKLLELEKGAAVNARLAQSDREQVECAALTHSSLQATNAVTHLHSPAARVHSEQDKQLEEPSLPADKLQDETRDRESEIKDLKESIFELQDHVEQLQAIQLHNNKTILDLEGKVMTLEQQKRELEKQLKMSNKKMKEEAEEWRHFQADLQTAVVVANEIKCEAQQEIHVLKRKLQEAERGMELLQQELEDLRASRLQDVSCSWWLWNQGYNLRIKGRHFKINLRRNLFHSEDSESLEFSTLGGEGMLRNLNHRADSTKSPEIYQKLMMSRDIEKMPLSHTEEKIGYDVFELWVRFHRLNGQLLFLCLLLQSSYLSVFL
ncbi:cytospin-B isoform X2 [Stegostoma tigrinum]|uniref:cytospin-B isoform X2 n=1 Tax=Stegostoma tigrinum TaxID=3053191 RepID=UPI00202B901B|nr:cytospin-B isoform X2 [Stegostoma tigrinum]